ncbi:hypothetical protein Tco_0207424 [Tanacetum coccineum]
MKKKKNMMMNSMKKNMMMNSMKKNKMKTLMMKKRLEEDAHVTLTPVIDTHKTGDLAQRSFVSFDFTSKLLNLDSTSPADNEIGSLMDTATQHATVILEITPNITTTIPLPPPFLHSL